MEVLFAQKEPAIRLTQISGPALYRSNVRCMEYKFALIESSRGLHFLGIRSMRDFRQAETPDYLNFLKSIFKN